MSENDQVKPFHAKEVASGQEAAEAVAAVLQHAQERDEAAKQKAPVKQQPKWILPLGLNLTVFAAYLLIWSPSWVVVNAVQPQPIEEQLRSTRSGVYMMASKIESYRQTNGSLPGTLSELGYSQPDLTYTVQGSDFVLYIEVGEEPVIVAYNSAQQSLADWGAANAGDISVRIGG